MIPYIFSLPRYSLLLPRFSSGKKRFVMTVVEPWIVVERGMQKGNLTGGYHRIDGKHPKRVQILPTDLRKDIMVHLDQIRLVVKDREKISATMGINTEIGIKKILDLMNIVMMKRDNIY